MLTVPQNREKEFDGLENINKWSKNIEGVFMPKKFMEIHKKVDEWKVNENDVWIVSFPKTGTTWTQEMVWLLLNDLNYKAAEKNLIKRSPQLEATAMVRTPYLNVFSPVIPHAIRNSLKYVKNKKSPACIKTHLPLNLLPKELKMGIKKPKIIYISRNPKDTCISYYYFSKLIKEFDGSLNEFCNLFLAGNAVVEASQHLEKKEEIPNEQDYSFFCQSENVEGIENENTQENGPTPLPTMEPPVLKTHSITPKPSRVLVNFAPFWNHVLPFWEKRNEPNILFLKYEDLKSDLPAAISKTAKFLNKDLTQEQLGELTNHLSFESMEQNPSVNYEWLVKMSQMFKPDRKDKDNKFMRQGKVGGYKEAMAPTMIERFDNWTEKNTTGTGLTYL